jgi:hypothetical protein
MQSSEVFYLRRRRDLCMNSYESTPMQDPIRSENLSGSRVHACDSLIHRTSGPIFLRKWLDSQEEDLGFLETTSSVFDRDVYARKGSE